MPESSLLAMFAQSVGALALVLAIFAGLVWGMRKFQGNMLPKAKSESMQVIQRLHIDSKNSVVEITYGDQHYLLGVGQGGIHKITTLPLKIKELEADA